MNQLEIIAGAGVEQQPVSPAQSEDRGDGDSDDSQVDSQVELTARRLADLRDQQDRLAATSQTLLPLPTFTRSGTPCLDEVPPPVPSCCCASVDNAAKETRLHLKRLEMKVNAAEIVTTDALTKSLAYIQSLFQVLLQGQQELRQEQAGIRRALKRSAEAMLE